MEPPNYFYIIVSVAAVVITLSFIIQAAMFIFINSSIKKLIALAASVQAKVEPIIVKAEPIVEKVGPVIDQVQTTITNAKGTVDRISAQAAETFDKVAVETRAVAAAISTTSLEITNLTKHQVEQLSLVIDQTTAAIQRQLVQIDQLLTRTQDRVEYTTIEVQATVLEPVREVSALLVGLRRTLDVLFGRDRKQIDQAYQDEELFI
ncbi:MAG TPA: hypothetical protein VKA70_17825 [Blastocatellia bacterium]|nr:hypothetical protein [Blastocatellia bacterium]